MKILYWLRDHWYLPLFILGVVLGLILRGRLGMPAAAQLGNELEAIRAGAEARRLKAIMGAQQAAEEVRKQHAATVQALNAEQAQQAEALRDDPVALSRFLVRAARSS